MNRPKDFTLNEGNQRDLLYSVLNFCKRNAMTETEVHYYLQSFLLGQQSSGQLKDLYQAAKRTFFVLMCRLGQVATFRAITDIYDRSIFELNDTVTYETAAKMLIRCSFGYESV